jgi:hypothetical protein
MHRRKDIRKVRYHDKVLAFGFGIFSRALTPREHGGQLVSIGFSPAVPVGKSSVHPPPPTYSRLYFLASPSSSAMQSNTRTRSAEIPKAEEKQDIYLQTF